MTAERLDDIDSRLAGLLIAGEQQQQSLAELTTNIVKLNQTAELLVSGIGQLLEGITELKATTQRHSEMAERQATAVEKLTQTAERQAAVAERQAQTAERQERNIERLSAVAELQAQSIQRLLEQQGR
jgi:methyl-accepting chemotaxis protein